MSTATTSTIVPAGTWAIDPSHSKVGFSVKHMGIATVRGEFEKYDGALVVGADGAYTVTATVEAASINTQENDRDAHLRSPDFFNAEEHPQLTLNASAVEKGDDELKITGQLTMNGVTNDVVLEAEVLGADVDPWGNDRVGLELRGQLSRGDYGMKFNQALGSGNMLVSDKVKIAIDVSLVKQQ
jgi:polyisoprenoid-binding protein YceI